MEQPQNPSGKLVVIGASAGALEALSDILPHLPADFPCPVAIVVHLPPDKESMLADVFDKKCKVVIKEAEDKEFLQAGTVYFAPPDYHLLIESDGSLSLSSEEPVLFSRPSIDVLFETAADAYGERLTGVILTGANEDGARGMRKIIDLGGEALILQPEKAFARAMPDAAIRLCSEAEVLTADALREKILSVR